MTRKNLYSVIRQKPSNLDELLKLYGTTQDNWSKVKADFHDDVIKYVKDKRVSDRVIEKNLKSLFNAYKILFPPVNTLLKRLNDIRTIIKEKRSEDLYRKSTYDSHFNISHEEKKKRVDEYNKKNVDMNKNPIHIDFDNLRDTLKELVDDKHVYKRGIGLLIASGLRPVELMCKAEFKIDNENKNNVIVGNLAKKRKGMPDSRTRPIIGLTPKQFINEVKIFRDDVGNPDCKAERVARGLQRAFNKEFPDLSKKGRYLFSRKLYSELAFQLYAPKNLKNNKPLYLSEILGHREGDVQTAQSYSWIQS